MHGVCDLHSLEQILHDTIAHVNAVLVEHMHQTAHCTLVILTQKQLHANLFVSGVTEAERPAAAEAAPLVSAAASCHLTGLSTSNLFMSSVLTSCSTVMRSSLLTYSSQHTEAEAERNQPGQLQTIRCDPMRWPFSPPCTVFFYLVRLLSDILLILRVLLVNGFVDGVHLCGCAGGAGDERGGWSGRSEPSDSRAEQRMSACLARSLIERRTMLAWMVGGDLLLVGRRCAEATRRRGRGRGRRAAESGGSPPQARLPSRPRTSPCCCSLLASRSCVRCGVRTLRCDRCGREERGEAHEWRRTNEGSGRMASEETLSRAISHSNQSARRLDSTRRGSSIRHPDPLPTSQRRQLEQLRTNTQAASRDSDEARQSCQRRADRRQLEGLASLALRSQSARQARVELGTS